MRNFWIFILAACFVFCGCDESGVDKSPPTENIELLVRMFDSLEARDFKAAGEQYDKLLFATGGQPSPLWVATITSNKAVTSSQKLLDAGHIDQALVIARDSKLSNPLNQDIDDLVRTLTFLKELKASADTARTATDSRTLDKALTSLKKRVASRPNETTALTALVTDSELRLNEMRLRESRLVRLDLLNDIYLMTLGANNLLPTLQAQYELERAANANNPVSSTVENEFYRR